MKKEFFGLILTAALLLMANGCTAEPAPAPETAAGQTAPASQEEQPAGEMRGIWISYSVLSMAGQGGVKKKAGQLSKPIRRKMTSLSVPPGRTMTPREPR